MFCELQRSQALLLLMHGNEVCDDHHTKGYHLILKAFLVDSLLNPCNCKSVWRCKCRTAAASGAQGSGLETLARAAAMCCSNEASTSTSPQATRKSTKRKPSRPGSPGLVNHKRPKNSTKTVPSPSPGPELAPIYFDTSSSSTTQIANPLPDFPIMPPISEIASLAGSGCTCGLQCACPGCVEHRGTEYASKERRDCAEGCGTCIDNNHGVALPGHDSGTTDVMHATTFLDKFFARAAALPAPPINRRMGVGVDLDPMNVMVYPGTVRATGEGGFAFGLVSLPKLECCGGRCACPNGTCGCGKSCNGSCVNHRSEGVEARRSPAEDRASTPMDSAATPQVVRSCCAGEAIAA
jgi:hypothetical protein